MDKLLEKAMSLTLQRFGRVMQLYAPLYLSNECIDTCTYCGFSFANKIPRCTLTPPEVEEEAQFLVRQGFQHLLLVSGEHPSHVSPEYLEEVLTRLRPHWASLSIETAPFSENVYRRLIHCGLDGVVTYQETYDPEAYALYHVSGPKKNYRHRLEAIEEAAKAGVRQLGMGILLGLADWKKDAQALADHLSQMRKKYWQTEFSLSFPRLRPCASDFQPSHPVSDHELIQLVASMRVLFPDVGLVLSTREPPELRETLLAFGVTRMSAGSRTEPGGYTHPDETLNQFEIEDHRSPAEIAAMLVAKGYEVVWKDWEPSEGAYAPFRRTDHGQSPMFGAASPNKDIKP